jgi:hypothetical protein
LTIVDVARHDASVAVRVTDGDRNRRIAFVLSDLLAAGRAEDQLNRWRDDRTQLTYVRNGADGVLLDDEQLFHDAYGDGLPELI